MACPKVPIINRIVKGSSSQSPQANKDTPMKQDTAGAWRSPLGVEGKDRPVFGSG